MKNIADLSIRYKQNALKYRIDENQTQNLN